MSRSFRRVVLLALLGTAPAIAKNYLFYGPLYVSGSFEVNWASQPGNTITVWDASTWVSKTTVDFAAFDAIVFGESFGSFAAAESNASVWSAAVAGRIFIVGTDPNYHGAQAFVQQGMAFAASGCRTGLYVILNEAYVGAPPFTPVPLLAGFGTFTARDAACSDTVAVRTPMPAYLSSMTTLTPGNLAGWNCSTHEVLDTIPPGFDWVANESSLGLPYLVARDGLGFMAASMPGVTTVSLGQQFPVLVTADDPGCGGVTNVSATLSGSTGGGAATAVSGPVPAFIAGIPTGSSGTFTWTFSAAGVGWIDFTGTITATPAAGPPIFASTMRSVLVQSPALLEGSVSAPAQVCAGVPYLVHLTVTNTGEADANGITATLFPGVTGTAPTLLVASPAGGSLVRGGETRVYSWTFTSTQTGMVGFTLSVSGKDANAAWPVTTGLQTSAAVSVVTPAALEAAMASPGLTPVGTLMNITLTVTNTGSIPVTAVSSVIGRIPAAASVVLVTGPGGPVPLSSGASVTFTWTYSVTGWGQVIFTATGSGADACHNVTATAAVPMLLGTPAAIAGSLLTALPDPVCAGALVTVRLSVTNTRDVPANLVSGAPGPLPVGTAAALLRSSPPTLGQLPGKSATVLTWTYTPTGAGTLSFSVTVVGTDARDATPLTTGLLGSNGITVLSSAVLMAAAAGPSGTLLTGAVVTVTLTITNTGGSTAPGVTPSAVVVPGAANAIPSGGIVPAGPVSLVPGGAVTFTWTYVVSGSGVVIPQLTVTASGCGGVLAPVTAGVALLVRQPAVLQVQSLTLLPVTTAGGSTVYATVVLRNTGDVPLTVTAFGLAVSGGLGSASSPVLTPFGIAPGGATTYTWSHLTPIACGNGSITVTANGTDNISGLPLASGLASNAIAISGAPTGLTMSVNPASANLGTNVTLRATLTDSCGLPVANTVLYFSVLTGGGAVVSASVLTDAAGVAITVWTLGGSPGANSARATRALAGLTADAAATGINPLALPGQGQAGLSANIINPARGEVAIARFFPINNEPVAVRIFTASGRLVRTLRSNQPMGDGQWMTIWDGKTEDEFPVARGVYLVRVTGGGLNETLKIVVAPH